MSVRTPEGKICTRTELVRRFGGGRAGEAVFTNGCFEILHPGHVALLCRARSLGDVLIVWVNTDASARRLGKGPGRPFVGASDRALVVAALECVDAVCLFDEDTPAALVAELVPAVLVKGGDYGLEDVAGRDTVEAAGGRVELIPLAGGHSTTELIDRMRTGEP